MLSSLFGGKKDVYRPVFPEDRSLIIPVADVPRTVAALAKSFRDDQGRPANIENHWIYTGTGNNALDQARFERTIGVHSSRRDVLDRVVNVTDTTFVSVAYHSRTNNIGVQLLSIPRETETGFMDTKSTFIANKGHLILDRPFAGYLTPALQQQLTQKFGSIDKITNDQLVQFVQNHSQKEEMAYVNGGSHGQEKVVYIPNSVTANIFATEGSYHPTRSFFEQYKENKYDGGELVADGHIHRALTEKRIGGDPWLAMLAQRFGPVEGASVLSLFDSDVLMQMENMGQHFEIPRMQYAARELFVINDTGDVVGHSILNMGAMMADEQRINRFIDVAKRSLSAPSNPEYRLAYHEMMRDFTTPKDIDEPMTPKDYAMLSSY